MPNRVANLVVWLILASPSWANTSARSLVGTGVDVLTRDKRDTWPIVEGSDPEDPVYPPVCSYQQSVELQIARDVNALESIIGIGGAASINIIIATATGSFDYEFSSEKVKNRVFVVFKAVVKNCSYRLKEPRFASKDIKDLYVEDYGAFRDKYGDRFVNVVTTGGSFLGIIAIDAGESRFKFSLAVELKVRIAFLVFKLGWREAFERIVDEYKNVEVQVLINSQKRMADSPERMWNLYREFTETLTSPQCEGKDGYLQCPYVEEKYESYSALTTTPDPAIEIRLAAEHVGQMQMRKSRLAELTSRIERIRDLADLHHSATPGEDVEQEVTSAMDAIGEINDELDDSIDQCRNAPFDEDGCVDPIETFNEDVLAIEMSLPKKNYPRDCKEIRELNEVYKAGSYTVYMNGEVTKPYEVFCERMEENDPEMYLVLKQTSPPSIHPRYNFARYLVYPKVDSCSEGDGSDNKDPQPGPLILSTTYDAVMVRPVGVDLLEVLPGQPGHRRQTGEAREVTIDGVRYTMDHVPYGRPMRFHAQGQDYDEGFVGNIDLNYTPFVIDKDISWMKTFEQGEKIESVPYELDEEDNKTVSLEMQREKSEKEGIISVVGDPDDNARAPHQKLVFRYQEQDGQDTGDASGEESP